MADSQDLPSLSLEALTFPLNESYIAFGDGSVTPSGVFYGLVLLPEAAITQTQQTIEAIKLRYGGSAEAPLHCRELFSGHARAKSLWAHISEAEAIALCGDVLRAVGAFQPKYLLGHIPSTYYPKRFRLRGKNGHPDLVHDLDEKWLLLWSYFHIAALLDPIDIIEPPDPIKASRPRNLPFWRMVMRRDDPGLRVRRVLLDRENTNIRWFSKSVKWVSVAKEMVIERPIGRSYLPVECAKDFKHPLLDLADIFVYSTGRSLSQGRQLEYSDFSAEVHVKLLWGTGEEIILGGTNHTADV